jgi:hypothetical protein
MEPLDRESGRKFEMKVFGFQMMIWQSRSSITVREIASRILSLSTRSHELYDCCLVYKNAIVRPHPSPLFAIDFVPIRGLDL